jgi:hypothetical protein
MTEQLSFDVLHDFGDFQIRRYPEHVLVQVHNRGSFSAAGNQAFNPLFQFISGSNSDAAKISMTAPVLQEEIAPASHVVSFVLPMDTPTDRVPAPRDARVTTKVVAGFDAAVMKFTGTWNESRLHAIGQELVAAVQREKLQTRGNVMFARFNPPWTPWFLRHNEALVALENDFTTAAI